VFSASLLSVMFRADDESTELSDPITFRDIQDMAKYFHVQASLEIPIVARTIDHSLFSNELAPFAKVTIAERGDNYFAWGRVPAFVLIKLFRERYAVPSWRESFDLGTTLHMDGLVSSNSFISDSQDFLQNALQTPPTVAVAIVDRGDHVTGGSPNNFAGRIQHVKTTDVVISDHASKVLWTLLDRLTKLGILAECQLFCALVKKPARQTGLRCFDHANCVEMLDAVTELGKTVAPLNVPLVVNMSLGTHVGPHNGESPFEQYLHGLASSKSGRFFFISGGNDGMSGVSGRRALTAGIQDCLKVRTGPNPSSELLVEFWWEEQPGSPVSVEVQVRDVQAVGIAKDWFLKPLRIDAATAGMIMKQVRSKSNATSSVQFSSLLHTRAHNNMCCAAFGLTCPSGSVLPQVDIEFTFESPADVTLNGWLVVSEDCATCFVEGTNAGTLRVPATDPDLICVTGVVDGGQPWPRSSRGPAAEYRQANQGQLIAAPRLAHRVELGHFGESGTSFASPRACADAADVVRDPRRLARLRNPTDLALELLGSPSPPTWNARTGFGAIVQ
jgi:hypothetical protein